MSAPLKAILGARPTLKIVLPTPELHQQVALSRRRIRGSPLDVHGVAIMYIET